MQSIRVSLPAARKETSAALRNHIPQFIDDLIHALRTSMEEMRPEILKFAHNHGSERANLSDYSIEVALFEYNVLRKVIFQTIERTMEIPKFSRELIYEAIQLAIEKASTEFTKLQMSNLAESHALFQELANALPQIIWMSKPDGHVYWYNKVYWDYTGLSEGTNWDDEGISPIHPDDMPDLVKKWMHSLKTGENITIEFRIRKFDGSYRWYLSRGVPIRDER